ncbi:MAG: hypothetical protein ACLQCB_16075 [Spirochaetia bacterium]
MRGFGKMAGFAAAGAFLLSLAVGLVSRNPFGVALARAFLFAVLFAGLAAGARYIITKYLPELATNAPPRAEGARGQNVDITLPEERPAPAGRASAYARESAESARRTGAGEEPETALGESSGEEGEILGAETPALDLEQPHAGGSADVLGDELDDVLPPLTEDGYAADADRAEASDESAEPVEEAESVSEEGSRGLSEEQSASGIEGELGQLPDISSLGEPPSTPRAPRRSESKPEDEMKGALGSRDPATLARAIRTVLKREEKG